MNIFKNAQKKNSIIIMIYLVVFFGFSVQMIGMNNLSLLMPLICVSIILLCTASTIKFRIDTPDILKINKREGITFLSIIVYAVLIYTFGFYIASIFLSWFIFSYISRENKKSLFIGGGYSLALVTVVYILFSVLLDYYIPGGWLKEVIYE